MQVLKPGRWADGQYTSFSYKKISSALVRKESPKPGALEIEKLRMKYMRTSKKLLIYGMKPGLRWH